MSRPHLNRAGTAIRFAVNGEAREYSGNPAKRLSDVLRDDFG